VNNLSKVKFKYTGDVVRSRELKKMGIQKLNILIKDMEFQKLKQNRREFRLEDGTIITCLHVFGLSYIEIFSPIYKEEKKEERIKEHFGKWAVITANNTLSLIWDIDSNKMIKLGLKQDMVDFVKNYKYKTTPTDFVSEPSSGLLLYNYAVNNYSLSNLNVPFNPSGNLVYTNGVACQYYTDGTVCTVDDSQTLNVNGEDIDISRTKSTSGIATSNICFLDKFISQVLGPYRYVEDASGTSSYNVLYSANGDCVPVTSPLVQNTLQYKLYYKVTPNMLQYVNSDINISLGVKLNDTYSYQENGSFYSHDEGTSTWPYGTSQVYYWGSTANITEVDTGSVSVIGELFYRGSLTETFYSYETAIIPYNRRFGCMPALVDDYWDSSNQTPTWKYTINSRKSLDYSIINNSFCCPKYDHFFYMEGVEIRVYHDEFTYPDQGWNQDITRIQVGESNLEIRTCTGKLSKLDLSKRNTALEIAMKRLSDRMVADYGYEYTINSKIIYLVKE